MSLQRLEQNGRSGKEEVMSTSLLQVGHFTESVLTVMGFYVIFVMNWRKDRITR